MQETTIGQMLINESLPEDMRDSTRVLDKKGIQKLMDEVARKHPEKYPEIVKNLSDIGRRFAYKSGGYGFGLKSLRQTNAAKSARTALSNELQLVYSNRNLTPAQMDEAVLNTVSKYQKTLSADVFAEAVKGNNPLAMQAVSGARGNPTNVNSLIGSDLLYEDHRGRPVPIPILRNYSMGLSPAEHFAGAFGARKGTLDLKQATADAGFLCLCENTEVRMADFSVKQIKDIVVGEWVLGSDMQGMTFPVRVTSVFNNGGRDLHDFVFRYGKSRTRTVTVRATNAHKALARYRCIYNPRQSPKVHVRRVDTYRLGDMLSKATRRHSLIAPQGFVDIYPMREEPLAWIIGLLIGDGGLTQNHISLSSGDPRTIATARQLLSPLGFCIKQIKNHEYEYCISDNAKGTIQGVRQRHTVNRLWQRLSALGLRGCSASQKVLPAEVLSWSNASIAKLLQGIMSSDGCVAASNNTTVPVVSIGMTSATLVDQIAELLAIRFGIYGQLSTIPCKGKAITRFPGKGYVAKHDLRKLTINDRESVLKFADIIGADGVRGDTLSDAAGAVSAHGRLDKFGFHFLHSTHVGTGNTCDLEVDHPDHLFVLANGAIVSNSKQLAQAVHRLIVTARDDENPYDESQPRGMEVDTADPDNEGSMLAHPVGGYPRNTVLTPKILKELKAAGNDNILVRSPTVGGPQDGGVYAMDAGYRDKGGLPPLGDMIGLSGSHAISEPLTQGQISSKHSGGVAGASAGAIGGFAAINAMAQAPKIFHGGAVHSQVDGKIDNIMDAPQGGQYLTVGGERHYIPRDNPATVKVGDTVEAGDTLTAGIPNPAEIVKHKGVGEGRRYFVNALRDVLRSSQITAHRRNVELLARGLLNHVRLTDEVGDWGPDDVVPYQLLESQWKPRAGYLVAPPKSLVGKYLEKPILHYSVGTQIKPSVVRKLDQYGIKSVYAHPAAPPFEPEMVRAMMNTAHDPDWQTKMLGSYQQGSVLEAARRGGVSDAGGTSYVPALAGSESFGITGPTKGWNPADIGRKPVDLTQKPKITSILD